MSDFLHRSALHNFWLKVMSLVLAMVLWFAVAHDPVTVVAVDVPIEFSGIPENLEISSETVPRAQVRMRGPERVIRRLQPADVYAEVDLSGIRPGERIFDLTSNQLHRPAELEIVQVLPSQFHIAFDLRITRQVTVQPRVIGKFADGYEIGHITVDPPSIVISGPKKHIEAVESATTDPIDMSGAISQISFVRHPYVSDPLIQVASPDPVRITITMEKVQGKDIGNQTPN
jgi:YbbR domain-containing protein